MDVKVAAGTYALTSTLTVNSDASILGGYDGSNWSVSSPGTNVTTISGSAEPLVNVQSTAGTVVIDGLTLQKGSTGSYAICVYATGSPTISRNNCVLSNLQSSDIGIGFFYGGSAMLSPGSGSVNVVDNTVRISGTAINTSLGVYVLGGTGGLIARNDLRITSGNEGFGIAGLTPNGIVIDSNVIDIGAVAGASENGGIGWGGFGAATITNNTVRFGSTSGPIASFGIGDLTYSTNTGIHYTMDNNIVWSGQNSGSTNCIQVTSGSSFTTLASNDLFSCSSGLVDVGSVNGAGGTESTTAIAVNALPNASGNVNTTIIGAGYFVNDTSDWRFQVGQLGTAEFVTLKQGGLVLTSNGALDIDHNLRPAGTVGDAGWSMGAYQQSY